MATAGLIVTSFIQYMYALEKLTLELRVYRDQLWVPTETLIWSMVNLFRFCIQETNTGCAQLRWGVEMAQWHHL